jgi:hypothetical protein
VEGDFTSTLSSGDGVIAIRKNANLMVAGERGQERNFRNSGTYGPEFA